MKRFVFIPANNSVSQIFLISSASASSADAPINPRSSSMALSLAACTLNTSPCKMNEAWKSASKSEMELHLCWDIFNLFKFNYPKSESLFSLNIRVRLSRTVELIPSFKRRLSSVMPPLLQVNNTNVKMGRFVLSHYLSFARWALFFLLPFFCFSSPPPQFSAHTALKVRHLPESHTTTQSQQLGQTHAVHCRSGTQGSMHHFSASA